MHLDVLVCVTILECIMERVLEQPGGFMEITSIIGAFKQTLVLLLDKTTLRLLDHYIHQIRWETLIKYHLWELVHVFISIPAFIRCFTDKHQSRSGDISIVDKLLFMIHLMSSSSATLEEYAMDYQRRTQQHIYTLINATWDEIPMVFHLLTAYKLPVYGNDKFTWMDNNNLRIDVYHPKTGIHHNITTTPSHIVSSITHNLRLISKHIRAKHVCVCGVRV
jgi:hypothetical protein